MFGRWGKNSKRRIQLRNAREKKLRRMAMKKQAAALIRSDGDIQAEAQRYQRALLSHSSKSKSDDGAFLSNAVSDFPIEIDIPGPVTPQDNADYKKYSDGRHEASIGDYKETMDKNSEGSREKPEFGLVILKKELLPQEEFVITKSDILQVEDVTQHDILKREYDVCKLGGIPDCEREIIKVEPSSTQVFVGPPSHSDYAREASWSCPEETCGKKIATEDIKVCEARLSDSVPDFIVKEAIKLEPIIPQNELEYREPSVGGNKANIGYNDGTDGNDYLMTEHKQGDGRQSEYGLISQNEAMMLLEDSMLQVDKQIKRTYIRKRYLVPQERSLQETKGNKYQRGMTSSVAQTSEIKRLLTKPVTIFPQPSTQEAFVNNPALRVGLMSSAVISKTSNGQDTSPPTYSSVVNHPTTPAVHQSSSIPLLLQKFVSLPDLPAAPSIAQNYVNQPTQTNLPVISSSTRSTSLANSQSIPSKVFLGTGNSTVSQTLTPDTLFGNSKKLCSQTMCSATNENHILSNVAPSISSSNRLQALAEKFQSHTPASVSNSNCSDTSITQEIKDNKYQRGLTSSVAQTSEIKKLLTKPATNLPKPVPQKLSISNSTIRVGLMSSPIISKFSTSQDASPPTYSVVLNHPTTPAVNQNSSIPQLIQNLAVVSAPNLMVVPNVAQSYVNQPAQRYCPLLSHSIRSTSSTNSQNIPSKVLLSVGTSEVSTTLNPNKSFENSKESRNLMICSTLPKNNVLPNISPSSSSSNQLWAVAGEFQSQTHLSTSTSSCSHSSSTQTYFHPKLVCSKTTNQIDQNSSIPMVIQNLADVSVPNLMDAPNVTQSYSNHPVISPSIKTTSPANSSHIPLKGFLSGTGTTSATQILKPKKSCRKGKKSQNHMIYLALSKHNISNVTPSTSSSNRLLAFARDFQGQTHLSVSTSSCTDSSSTLSYTHPKLTCSITSNEANNLCNKDGLAQCETTHSEESYHLSSEDETDVLEDQDLKSLPKLNHDKLKALIVRRRNDRTMFLIRNAHKFSVRKANLYSCDICQVYYSNGLFRMSKHLQKHDLNS